MPISYWAFFPRNQLKGLFWKSIIFVSFLLYLKTIYICFPSFILLLQCLSRQGASLRQAFSFSFFLTFSPQLVENWSNFASSFDQVAQPSTQFQLYMFWQLLQLWWSNAIIAMIMKLLLCFFHWIGKMLEDMLATS